MSISTTIKTALLCACVLTASAQTHRFPHIDVVFVQPVGACTPANTLEQYNGDLYTCDPNTLLWRAISGGGGGGGSSPGAPFASMQFNNNSAFAGTGPVNGALFAGATPGNQIDNACAVFGGAHGTVILPPGMAAGLSVNGVPSKCNIIDYRGNSLVEPYGTIDGNESNALVTFAAESTPTNLTPNTYAGFANQMFAYQALAGGNNSYNGSSGAKTNYINAYLSEGYRTVGQKQGLSNNVFSFSAGDTLPFTNSVFQFGGYGTNGDEQTVGIENLFYHGLASFGQTDGLGGSAGGTITGINSSTGVVTYTPATSPTNLEYTMGEQRFIRDLGSVVTGTYTNAVNSGTAPTTVTITGTGFSALAGYASNPHTTWGGLSSSGQILTNNVVFCADPAAGQGYDACFPVNTISNDTTLTLNLYSTGSSMNTGWAWATSGGYHLYRSAWPTNVNLYAHTFTACNPTVVPSSGTCDVSGLTNGHRWDQVVAYNTQFTGERIAFQHPMGISYRDVGVDVQNQTALPAKAALSATGPMLAALVTDQLGGQAPNSTIQIGQRGSGGVGTIFPDRTPASTNQWSLYEYIRSDGQNQGKPIWFDANTASLTEGVNLFNAINVSSPGPGGANRGASIPLINGGVQVGTVFNPFAGGLGAYSNLALASRFYPGNAAWTLACVLPNPATVTANTVDVTDPLPPYGNTAEKFVSQSTTGTGCGSGVSQQQQTVTGLSANVPYTVSFWLRGAAGGEVVIIGANVGGTVYDIQVPLLTTGWKRYSYTFTPASVTGTNYIFFYTGTVSSTIYVADAQLEQSPTAGFPVLTTTSQVAPSNGIVAHSLIVDSMTPGTASVCPNGPNGALVNDGTCAGGLSGQTVNYLPKATSANASTGPSVVEDIGTGIKIHGSGASTTQTGTNTFSALAACAAGTEGTRAPVTDSTTNTWGATITGGGTNHVYAYCDGSAWTVMGK